MFALAAALATYPPLLALVQDGTLGAFRYLAADSFYYLTVATRSIDAPAFTFDGVHATNGFHPLWQVLLGSAAAWLPLDSAGLVYFALGVGIVLVAIGTGLFALAVFRLTRRPALSLFAAVPGPFLLLVPGTWVGVPWSFANGMESPLSIFFFGVLLVALTGRGALHLGQRPRALLAVSALLTLLTLSRLDDVFLFAPFLLWVGWSAPGQREAMRRLAVAGALPLVVLGSYLVYNQLSAGSLLPSSGSSKAEPLLALARNSYALVTTFAPFLDLLREDFQAWAGEAWRVAQMVVPVGIAAAWLLSRARIAALARASERRGFDPLVSLLAGYVLLKGGYNFAMVALWQQGHWYYPVSIMTCNLIVAVAATAWLDAVRPVAGTAPAPPARGAQAVALLAALGFALWSANAFIDEQREARPRDRRHVFWSERAVSAALLQRECPGCGLLSFDDGIVAYSLPDVSTLNGLGLTMDVEALEARREGRLLDLAWERGIRLLASVSYEMPEAAYSDAASLRSHLAAYPFLRGQHVDRWRFDVAFESPASNVRFVRFRPEPSR